MPRSFALATERDTEAVFATIHDAAREYGETAPAGSPDRVYFARGRLISFVELASDESAYIRAVDPQVGLLFLSALADYATDRHNIVQ